MADDIVTRLREWQAEHEGTAIGIYDAAADEIERLRAELRKVCRRCRMGCHEAHGVICNECEEARRG